MEKELEAAEATDEMGWLVRDRDGQRGSKHANRVLVQEKSV